jgi:hypothetical protein
VKLNAVFKDDRCLPIRVVTCALLEIAKGISALGEMG